MLRKFSTRNNYNLFDRLISSFDSKIDPCGVCGTRVKSNSALCTASGKWIHARCTDKKKVAVYLNKNYA